jgi:hypothetical protein
MPKMTKNSNLSFLRYVSTYIHICGGREKVGKSNNFKNELTMFTP